MVADETCNAWKTDSLAAVEYVDAWRARLDEAGSALTAIADRATWESSPERTLGVARALYLPMRSGARVWSAGNGLVSAEPGRFHAALAR